MVVQDGAVVAVGKQLPLLVDNMVTPEQPASNAAYPKHLLVLEHEPATYVARLPVLLQAVRWGWRRCQAAGNPPVHVQVLQRVLVGGGS